MDHDISYRAERFSMRPVRLSDAEFIVELRTDPILGRYIHPTSPSVDVQREWLTKYLQTPDEWFFIVEDRDGSREGTICIYNVDRETESSEWGRWVMRHGSVAALESAVMIYDVGFDQLGLKNLYGRTESVNKPVISFHTSMDLVEVGAVDGPNGEHWIQQEMTAERWPAARAKIEPILRRISTARS